MTHIRTAEKSDLDFIRECIEELKGFPFDPVQFSKTWKALQAWGSYSAFVISSEEKPCGFLGINILPQLHHNGKVAEILELVILPDFRNRQIGKEALDFAQHFAREKECVFIELATGQKRVDAQRFYQKNGFQNSHFKLTMEL
jgi:PhnO protein